MFRKCLLIESLSPLPTRSEPCCWTAPRSEAQQHSLPSELQYHLTCIGLTHLFVSVEEDWATQLQGHGSSNLLEPLRTWLHASQTWPHRMQQNTFGSISGCMKVACQKCTCARRTFCSRVHHFKALLVTVIRWQLASVMLSLTVLWPPPVFCV